MADLDWRSYVDPEFTLVSFPPGSTVLDVGCGQGRHLRAMRGAGLLPIGVEPESGSVDALRSEGFDVRQGIAESLPIAQGRVDGVLCSVTLPYTDERQAVLEWGRVLRPGGEVRATYHGVGYFIRYLVAGPDLRHRAYGLRTILATWYYALIGRRAPGWLGDTLYQSERRLERYYHSASLAVLERPRPRSFLGFPVFIAHRLRKEVGEWPTGGSEIASDLRPSQ